MCNIPKFEYWYTQGYHVVSDITIPSNKVCLVNSFTFE